MLYLSSILSVCVNESGSKEEGDNWVQRCKKSRIKNVSKTCLKKILGDENLYKNWR